MEHLRHPDRTVRHALSSPFIYAILIPAIFLDIMIELYHRICFPLYGLSYVRRSDYIKIDRHKLAYLHLLQKINCMYCGYINGLLMYDKEIAGRTEAYWCGIMHQKRPGFRAPPNHKDFLPYGDEQAFDEFQETIK